MDVEQPHTKLSPLADGLWFIADAAWALAQQEGMSVEGRHDLSRRMSECAKLPVEHPHHLCTRHLQSRLPKKHTQEVELTTGVYPADVNDWLEAIKVPYRWSAGTALRDKLVAQRTSNPKLRHRQKPPPQDAGREVPQVVRHSTDDRRQDLLTPLIRKAEELAGPGASASEVWAQLQHMARSTPPPAPLSKVTSGGVVYFDGPSEKVFTVRALRDRLRRARAR